MDIMAFKSALRWYFNRIRYISLRDLLYRFSWKLKQQTFYRLKAKGDSVNYSDLDIDEIFSKFKNDKYLIFPFDDADKKIIKSYRSFFNFKKIIEEADSYCKHIFSYYDLNKISLGKEINWNKDYKTNKIWPSVFHGSINHNSAEVGDIKYVWEINRHQHFYSLGKAYYLTGDEKYAKEIINEIESWIKQNPYLVGVNWFSSLEISLRVLSWTWALQFIKSSKTLTKEVFDKILKYIYLQEDFVYNNLSLYSSANNHLIGEVAVLFIVSKAFPFFNHSEKWKNESGKILIDEIKKQICSDGTNVEQAPNYLAFVLDFYLQAKLISNFHAPQDILDKIEKSGEFLMNLVDLNQEAQIGDCADDFVSQLGINEVIANYRSVLNSLSLIYGRSDFKFFGKNMDEKTFWLFGSSSIKKHNLLKDIELRLNSKDFPKGGYYFLRNSESILLFDCGSLGYDLCASGHGHADSLSFWLSYKNKEFFVDSGTYNYHNKLRDYFRLTSSHNTIKINEREQSGAKGEFIWGKKAKSFVKYYKTNKGIDFVSGYHDGFKPRLHQREIINNKKIKSFFIRDKISGNNRIIEIFFHLHPDVKITKSGKNSFLISNESARMEITFDDKLSIQLKDMLYSNKYGIKEKNKVIYASNKNDKEFITKIKLI